MSESVMFGPQRDIELLQEVELERMLEDPQARANMMAWLYFGRIVIHTSVKPGWSLDGCSLSQRGPRTLLVVKATHEGTPYVAFTTEATTTGCVRSFCRRWLEERVEWRKDKYREI